MNVPVKAFKAFDENMKCRDFQYEVGKEFEIEGRIEACDRGFHACEDPWDVLRYYPITSRFAEVEMSGAIDKRGDKVASSKILIKAEIGLSGWLKAAIDMTWEQVKPENVKATGGLASSGNNAKIGASGNYAQIGASGDNAKIGASGNYAQIGASGDNAKIGASGYNAKIGASGYNARTSAVGFGSSVDSTGEGSIAAVLAPKGRAKASKGSWIVLSAHDSDGKVLKVKTAQAGVTKGVKADTWYVLTTEGKFEEVA
jgi:hypothetical protein